MAIWTPSQKTKTKKVKSEGLTHVYSVEVPAAKIQDEMQNVFVQLQLSARVQGFRAGKAPLDVIKRQYGDAARSEAAERAIKAAIPEALKENELRPIAVPSVGKVQLPPNGPLTFELHVEVAPVFTPTGYKGISVEKKEAAVADKEIEERLTQLREGNARLETAKEEAVAKTHYAVIDYELSQGGKPLKGGKGSQELVDLSSDQSVEGLSEGLVGMKRGEVKEFAVKIDKKDASCKATVTEIKTKILPELNDEFAKDMGLDTMAKLREEIKKVVQREAEEKIDREVSTQIEKALLEANKFDVPPTLVEHQTQHMFERLSGALRKQKISDEQKNELLNKLRPQAEDTVRLQFILAEVSKKENIEATEADWKAEKEKAMAGARDDEERGHAEKFYDERKDDVLASLRERKVIALIRDAVKYKKA